MVVMNAVTVVPTQLDHICVHVHLGMSWIQMQGHVLVSSGRRSLCVVLQCTSCIIDTNECGVNNGGCDSTNGDCDNTIGSYTCTCNIGYQLSEDGHTCEGESDTSVL